MQNQGFAGGPVLPGDVLPRPRLLAHGDALCTPGITLLIAPAGFGKTTLLAGWAQAVPWPIAWVGLGANDRGAEPLAMALIDAIRRVVPGFGESTLALLRGEPAPEVVGRSLAAEFAALDAPLVLILDDYHDAADADADMALTHAFRVVAPMLRVVIASRLEPGIALARLRASGLVTEFGPEDLRFTREETAAFLGSLEESALDGAERWSEAAAGWPVALRVFATAVRQREGTPGAPVQPLLAAHRTLRDFLIEEVLDRQPGERRNHLLALSLPDRIDRSLCAALCGLSEQDAAALLEPLVFVDHLLTPDDAGRLRFHTLVRNTFRDELRARSSPERIAALHTEAASTLERTGDIEAAIGHLRAAGDDAAAAALVERHVWQAIDLQRRDLLDRWLRALPPQAVEESPVLSIGQASCQLTRGNDKALTSTLARIDRLLEAESDRWPARERDRMQGVADLYRLSSGLYENMDDPAAAYAAAQVAQSRLGEGRSIAHGTAIAWQGFMRHLMGDREGAVDLLQEATMPRQGPPDAMTVYLLVSLCAGLTLAGLTDRALAAARDANRVFTAMGLPEPNPWLLAWQGSAHLLRLEPAAAAAALGGAWTVRSRIGAIEARETALGLALSCWLLGRRAEGVALLETFIAEAEGAQDVTWWAAALSMRARLALLNGDLHAARTWLRRYAALDARQPMLVVLEEPPLTTWQIAIAEGGQQAANAAAQLPAVIAGYDARQDLANAVRGRVLLTMARKAARFPAQDVLAPLAAAAEIAEPHGILLPFGEHRNAIARTLKLAGVAAERIAEEIDGALDGLSEPADPVARTLSRREQQILDGLRDGLTRREIGDRLSISPATVKRHTAKIYDKLGVSGRLAAADAVKSASAAPRPLDPGAAGRP